MPIREPKLLAYALICLLVIGTAAAKLPAAAMQAVDKQQVSAAIPINGLMILSRKPLTVDGSRMATIYTQAGCNGYLLVLPTGRNAEDAVLFQQLQAEKRYLLSGHLHTEFPEVEFWLRRIDARINPFSRGQPVVYAMAETGACALTKTFRDGLATR